MSEGQETTRKPRPASWLVVSESGRSILSSRTRRSAEASAARLRQSGYAVRVEPFFAMEPAERANRDCTLAERAREVNVLLFRKKAATGMRSAMMTRPGWARELWAVQAFEALTRSADRMERRASWRMEAYFCEAERFAGRGTLF